MVEVDLQRRIILDSAGKLFAERGVERTTIRAIADAAGIVLGSLYHYYPHKKLILRDLIDENLHDLLDTYGGIQEKQLDPADELRELILASLKVSYRHPHASEVYQAERDGLLQVEGFEFLAQASDRVKGFWIRTITRGIESGAFRPQIPPEVIYRLIRDTVWLAVPWMQTADRGDFEDNTRQCVRLILDGVASAPAVKSA